ncbi:hypothetical protein DAPPUDRAFT_232811 [Daphnia pulex]|uniref:Uncharacterized protein n=1 Tax=Daphnia pulex TaxID=6669 RepID=E9FSF1_DAPPU|nr:hypothetical protein DAPPUDRAFT_232811 [Daphnia pulex]|eukprot:EFX89197.1 hypothetical protein DAPPUDRAFT_232811 [Daphnia pulex]
MLPQASTPKYSSYPESHHESAQVILYSDSLKFYTTEAPSYYTEATAEYTTEAFEYYTEASKYFSTTYCSSLFVTNCLLYHSADVDV